MGGGAPRRAKSVAKGGGGGSSSAKRKVSSRDEEAGGDGAAAGSAGSVPKKPRREQASVGKMTSGIKNKIARSELYGKLKHVRALEKKKLRVARQKAHARALEAGETPEPRQVPKTIENQRVRDETFVEAGDDEVAEEDAEDEFASYFSGASSPKVIITTSRKPSGEMFKFLENLFSVIPNAYYYSRRAYHVQEIVKLAKKREFTDLLVFNENKKFSHGARVNGLLHVHLPDGPSCLYRLSSLVLTKKIRNHGRATNHHPELILNNFSTRLGHRVGRMFASVFPQRPEFNGRRVVTFHNQRDFIFFRHHRYIFQMKKAKSGLTLKEAREAKKARKKKKGEGKGEARVEEEESGGDDDGDSSGGGSSSEEEDFSDVESDSEGGASRARTKKRDDAPRGDGGSEAGETVKARLQELGPRFTLKLMSIQKGTFDSEHGEYEYVRNGEVDGTRHTRRKFVL